MTRKPKTGFDYLKQAKHAIDEELRAIYLKVEKMLKERGPEKAEEMSIDMTVLIKKYFRALDNLVEVMANAEAATQAMIHSKKGGDKDETKH